LFFLLFGFPSAFSVSPDHRSLGDSEPPTNQAFLATRNSGNIHRGLWHLKQQIQILDKANKTSRSTSGGKEIGTEGNADVS
jgi:hypothetical protein